MTDKTKLLNDYESLTRNDFWKLYMSKLVEYSKGRALTLRDAPLDKVARIQGELSAIDWAISRPHDIFETLVKEAQT